ncbi:DENN-domain-containing protein [Myriangium duriaei CBS 260.36]|uniref:DENN-domain-containing protein n=1 Tax=Myriangium duriaei CBS 260.36 TaxID=1168546 RepID=A0A9P4IY57_9PEZI|nr:DENN-domain-containing protein [Myriangium duriaei CBS 260.36]
MAPHVSPEADAQAASLADYFYIAGIEISSIYDERNGSAASPPVETTIDEDIALVTDASVSPRPETPGSSAVDGTPRRSKRYSFEARKSRGSIVLPPDLASPPSKRNSASTLKGTGLHAAAVLSEEDFDQALRKFASERDSFLEEIHVSAGTVTTPQARGSRARPKAIRIKSSEDTPPAGLRGGVGSLRRKLSTMSSIRRPSAPPSRQASVNTSRRLSGYNSVIPPPEPFKVDPLMHPLKRRYEPVLLDRYPTKEMSDESKRRCSFPDFVPMFAFPNDVSVVSADERPRSTWHGFAMTAADGSRLHSICITVWMPLVADASAELERQCETWRRANMSEEERELASSLGERLAGERAKLSRLLSLLPTIPSESDEREDLEDEISEVEERIALMADLLRPVRHAAASKIEGLTQSETGFWTPRVYGVLGRDAGMTSFWKEWLKAIIVPMTDGGVLNVPASSPRVGMWQPLERYVVNLCVEAPTPLTSLTQVEVAIRELRLYARKEAINELPGSRNTDLYSLFRALSIPTIVTLFECAIAESRIILLSSHTSMLHLASAALSSILYPLKWSGIFIPVLPSRLLQALDAPCPYIVGVERRYEAFKPPTDDHVLVDLDEDIMEGTAPRRSLPRQIRRKLTSLLQAAAPHHNRFGVPIGPPPYAVETFPSSLFASENPQIFNSRASPSTLSSSVTMSSSSFGDVHIAKPGLPVFNAFLHARGENPSDRRPSVRPGTSSTTKGSQDSVSFTPPSPCVPSPLSGSFPPTPVSRSDSAFGMQTGLREKRSGQFDTAPRRSSSFGLDRINPLRRPSQPFVGGHSPSLSTSTLSTHMNGAGYAPSVYAPSSMAASTVFPSTLVQQVKDTDSTKWVEGHCMVRKRRQGPAPCSICNERCNDDAFICTGCSIQTHAGCVSQTALVCPVAFRPDLIRAAFVRCFASLLYTYRRFLNNASGERRKSGLLYHFNADAFVKSVPADHADYLTMLRDTQAFNEFIHERETKRAEDPSIKLFDEIILSKRNRGKTSLFSKSTTSFLSDSSDHLWRTATAAPPNSRFPGDYRQIVSRIPAKLDPSLMKEPRANQGAPRIPKARTTRKPIPSMLGLAVDLAGTNIENQDPLSVDPHHIE